MESENIKLHFQLIIYNKYLVSFAEIFWKHETASIQGEWNGDNDDAVLPMSM